jgi:dCTP diphosphatase
MYGVRMEVLNVAKIMAESDKFVEERDWNQFHSIKNLSMALSVECSELVEIFQWMPEDESNKVDNAPKLQEKVEEELADIFIYLLRIAKKSGVDLEKAALDKIQKNSEKYPVEKAKGNSKKYNEF